MLGWDKAVLAASKVFGVLEAAIITPRQTGRGRPAGPIDATEARQILMYLFRERGERATVIADATQRDTSAVYHAHRKIKRLLSADNINSRRLQRQIKAIGQ